MNSAAAPMFVAPSSAAPAVRTGACAAARAGLTGTTKVTTIKTA